MKTTVEKIVVSEDILSTINQKEEKLHRYRLTLQKTDKSQKEKSVTAEIYSKPKFTIKLSNTNSFLKISLLCTLTKRSHTTSRNLGIIKQFTHEI